MGMNLKAAKGRHKLTLLRERGAFLPIDPLSSWLEGVTQNPQPEAWKHGLRVSLQEAPS